MKDPLITELASVILELLALVGREADDPEVARAYAALVKVNLMDVPKPFPKNSEFKPFRPRPIF